MIVTTQEAAEFAGIPESTILTWVSRGELRPVRQKANPLRFRYDDVIELQHSKRSQRWLKRHAEKVERWHQLTNPNSSETIQNRSTLSEARQTHESAGFMLPDVTA